MRMNVHHHLHTQQRLLERGATMLLFFKFKRSVILAMIAPVALVLLAGCDPTAAVKPLFKPSTDKDVTTEPRYNFSSFTNSIWKTKTKTAIADLKRYTGAPEPKLLTPSRFDSDHPRYNPIHDMKIVAVLPPGTRLRISRLMEDQGAWGGVQVEAVLLDGTNANKAVYLDGFFVAGNAWSRGPAENTKWDADPEMLEVP